MRGLVEKLKFVHLGGGRFKIYTSRGELICAKNSNDSLVIGDDSVSNSTVYYLLTSATRRIYIS